MQITVYILTVFLRCNVDGLAEVALAAAVNRRHSYGVQGERLQVVQRILQHAYRDVVYGAAGCGTGPRVILNGKTAEPVRVVLGQQPLQFNTGGRG